MGGSADGRTDLAQKRLVVRHGTTQETRERTRDIAATPTVYGPACLSPEEWEGGAPEGSSRATVEGL